MLETTNKFVDEVNELKKEFLKEIAEDILTMDANSINLMKKCFGLFDTSIELCKKQAELIDSMNHKLNKLDRIDNKLDKLLKK